MQKLIGSHLIVLGFSFALPAGAGAITASGQAHQEGRPMVPAVLGVVAPFVPTGTMDFRLAAPARPNAAVQALTPAAAMEAPLQTRPEAAKAPSVESSNKGDLRQTVNSLAGAIQRDQTASGRYLDASAKRGSDQEAAGAVTGALARHANGLNKRRPRLSKAVAAATLAPAVFFSLARDAHAFDPMGESWEGGINPFADIMFGFIIICAAPIVILAAIATLVHVSDYLRKGPAKPK